MTSIRQIRVYQRDRSRCTVRFVLFGLVFSGGFPLQIRAFNWRKKNSVRCTYSCTVLSGGFWVERRRLDFPVQRIFPPVNWGIHVEEISLNSFVCVSEYVNVRLGDKATIYHADPAYESRLYNNLQCKRSLYFGTVVAL